MNAVILEFVRVEHSKYIKGVLSLIFLAFGFAVIAITARYLSFYFTLFQQLYLSLGTAFLLSLVIFKNKLTIKTLKKVSSRDWFIMIFRVVIGYLIGASLYRQALILTKISNVTFIQSIPFAALYGWIIFKEKFSARKLLLISVAYIGVIIISVRDFSSIFSFGRGEIYSLISAALFSLVYVSRKWQSDFLTDKQIAQILLFFATALFVIVSVVKSEPLPQIRWEWLLAVSLLFTGLFNALNIFFINYGFRNVKTVLASNILTLESVFALLLAYVFYRELPTVKELIGGILILGSVIQMNRLEAH